MEKVRLQVEKDTIDKYLNRLPGILKATRQLYDKLNSEDYSTNLKELKELVQKYYSINSEDYRKFYVENFAKELTVNAINDSRSVKHIKKEELVKMIHCNEDFINEIIKVIHGFSVSNNQRETAVNLDLFANYITFDPEQKKPKIIDNHKEAITERYTIYAENERQVKAYEVCKGLVDAINTHFNTPGLGLHRLDDYGLPGLILTNQTYKVDVNHILRIL